MTSTDSAFRSLLPQRLDNTYRGRMVALWLFGLVVLMKSLQSLMIIFRGYATARDADGVPLGTYAADAAQAVVAIFAQASLWRLTFCALALVVLLRYRSAVPLMFALFAVNYLAGEVILRFVPLVRVGAPLGPTVNMVLFAVMVAGLALSLWPRRTDASRAEAPQPVR